MYYNQISDKPCAYITKSKQRIKQFGQNVYLKDGSEFEVELYNPSRKTVLSKIKINGEFITGGGIVLRPGERVFLERYIDVPNKFKFETYTVDSTNETMNAIANNGDVEILFYEEQDVSEYKINSNLTWNPTYTTNNYNDVIGTYFNASLNLTSFESNSEKLSFNNNPRSSKFESKYDPRLKRKSSVKKSRSVETGRIEKGSSSDQEFKTVNKNFNSWTVSTSVWKILPESQKPIEKKDLIERCSQCSTKIKKSSWKFCPECGNELKQETYEDQLSKLSKEELIELLKNK